MKTLTGMKCMRECFGLCHGSDTELFIVVLLKVAEMPSNLDFWAFLGANVRCVVLFVVMSMIRTRDTSFRKLLC